MNYNSFSNGENFIQTRNESVNISIQSNFQNQNPTSSSNPINGPNSTSVTTTYDFISNKENLNK